MKGMVATQNGLGLKGVIFSTCRKDRVKLS